MIEYILPQRLKGQAPVEFVSKSHFENLRENSGNKNWHYIYLKGWTSQLLMTESKALHQILTVGNIP